MGTLTEQPHFRTHACYGKCVPLNSLAGSYILNMEVLDIRAFNSSFNHESSVLMYGLCSIKAVASLSRTVPLFLPFPFLLSFLSSLLLSSSLFLPSPLFSFPFLLPHSLIMHSRNRKVFTRWRGLLVPWIELLCHQNYEKQNSAHYNVHCSIVHIN